jgi:hypothetical protein
LDLPPCSSVDPSCETKLRLLLKRHGLPPPSPVAVQLPLALPGDVEQLSSSASRHSGGVALEGGALPPSVAPLHEHGCVPLDDVSPRRLAEAALAKAALAQVAHAPAALAQVLHAPPAVDALPRPSGALVLAVGELVGFQKRLVCLNNLTIN